MPLFLWCRQDQSCFIKKLQKVRDIIGRPIIITSGVRCEFYNTSIKASMNSSHIPDSYGMGNAVDIACTNSKDRYELVELSQKFFKRIGISGGQYGGFVHLDVDRSKVQEVMWLYWKGGSPSFQPNKGWKVFQKGFSGGTSYWEDPFFGRPFGRPLLGLQKR